MQIVEVVLRFEGCSTTITIKDRLLLVSSPKLIQEISLKQPNAFENNEDIQVELDEADVPAEAAKLVFSLLPKYQPPEMIEHVSLNNYPELNALEWPELKEVMDVARYYELGEFMKCIGFVIGRKFEACQIIQFLRDG